MKSKKRHSGTFVTACFWQMYIENHDNKLFRGRLYSLYDIIMNFIPVFDMAV